MRKLIVSSAIACVMLLSAASHAQVYNTAQKLKGGTFRLCTAPLLIVNHGDINAGLYLLGGIGVTRIMDFYLHTRVAGSDLANFGADLQWALIKGTPALSLSTGLHVGPNIGIDGTLDMAFPVGNSVVLYGGLDMDIDFTPGDIAVPAWVFIGPRVQIRRNTTLFMEADIGITHYTPSIVGLGLSFYL
jgi:hypothetical protein